jgi:hypothetical protein
MSVTMLTRKNVLTVKVKVTHKHWEVAKLVNAMTRL